MFVGAWELLRFGRATKVETHRSLARVPHDRQLRRAAKSALKYPPVRFSGFQARAAIRGFARAVVQGGYVVYACSILPDHVHMVVARHARLAERIAGHFKAAATRQLRAEGLHPFEAYVTPDGSVPTVWAGKSWKVFLDSSEDVRRAIAYVENNPPKEGMDPQEWSFVVPFAG